ncbi:MAG: DUF1284 domain-containing protein [Gammaproteobacteria bacterium]
MKLRPHHFLCIFCFQGKGYSPEFIANLSLLVNFLNSKIGEDTPITITPKATEDAMCAACPNLQSNGLCASQEKVASLDAKHSQVLNLRIDQVVTWKEIKQRILERVTLEKFTETCAGCDWYKVCILKMAK